MKVVIVEDEVMVARRLARCTKTALTSQLSSIDTFNDIDSARTRLDELQPDVLLLDLNLQGRDGFALLESAVAGSFDTIVVSANTHRAIEAFDYDVVDFVPKPFTTERLAQAFGRLGDEARAGRGVRYLVVRHAGQLERIRVEDVRAIHGANDYAELELTDGSTRMHEKSLSRLARLLSHRFIRIHRSHIVNRECIQSLATLEGSRYRLTLTNDRQLPVGRKWIESLRNTLADESERI